MTLIEQICNMTPVDSLARLVTSQSTEPMPARHELTISKIKHMARVMRKNGPLRYNQCLERLAIYYGFKNYNDFRASLGGNSAEICQS